VKATLLFVIGEEIHGYRIVRALSQDKGGFGEVFFARHESSGAEAVIKVLKAEMSAHRDIVTRFFNEARAAAAIQHPSIVVVHNVGYVQGRAYLLMERLRGEDLETRLSHGTPPLDVALRFLRQAAGAVGAAHQQGIVHRDLKPANLFVVPDPEVVGGERIKVLDFGIAKLGAGGTMKTQGVFGTPAYMSPEQCGSAADVDPRTDIYALGCILYELISGRPPFGHGGLELIAAHLRDEPPAITSFRQDTPTSIQVLVSKLLQKRREDRVQSCSALIEEIDVALRDLSKARSSRDPSSERTVRAVEAPTIRADRAGQPPSDSPAVSAAPTPPIVPTGRRDNGRRGWLLASSAGIVSVAVVAAIVATRGSNQGHEPGQSPPEPKPEVTAATAAARPTAPVPPPPGATPAEIVANYERCASRSGSESDSSLGDCFAADVETAINGGHDVAAATSETKLLRTAFPDLRSSFELILVDSNHVASIARITGTHTGALALRGDTFAATNKPIALQIPDVVDLEPGGTRATKRWGFVDWFAVLSQIGALDGPTPALSTDTVQPKVVIANHDETERRNVSVVESALQAFNRHDSAALGSVLQEDSFQVLQPLSAPQDQKTFLDHSRALWAGFPDVRVTASSMWGAGDYVVTVGTMTGTNSGDYAPLMLDRSGKQFTTPTIDIMELRDNKIQRWWSYDDQLGAVVQLGTFRRAKPDGASTPPASPAPIAAALDADDVYPRIHADRACRGVSTATGRVWVTMKVAPSGSVGDVAIDASPDDALSACVQQNLRHLRFPKTQQGGQFSFSVTF
jgi:serine/threonine-protein kinase